jgi:hypothetical protein
MRVRSVPEEQLLNTSRPTVKRLKRALGNHNAAEHPILVAIEVERPIGS